MAAVPRVGLALLAAALSVGVPAFSGGGAVSHAQAPAVATVRAAGNLKFQPARTVIGIGGSVTWVQVGPRGHTVLSWDGKHATGATAINGGVTLEGYLEDSPGKDRYTVTFAKPGTYPYYCNVEDHYLAGMTGEVIVLAAGQTTAPPVKVDAAAASPAATDHADGKDAAAESESHEANIPVIAGLLIASLLGIFALSMALRGRSGGTTTP